MLDYTKLRVSVASKSHASHDGGEVGDAFRLKGLFSAVSESESEGSATLV